MSRVRPGDVGMAMTVGGFAAMLANLPFAVLIGLATVLFENDGIASTRDVPILSVTVLLASVVTMGIPQVLLGWVAGVLCYRLTSKRMAVRAAIARRASQIESRPVEGG